ncbi:MAG: GldG family protein [Syntrophobacteraceae bacterium]
MPAKTRGSRKWVYGSNTIISTIIFLAILIFVILIAERHPWRMDLTESGSFSLSGQTKNVLKEIEQPVQIKGFYSSAAPDQVQAKAKIQDLLDTYRYHNKNISYEFIDPDSQPEVARRYEVKTYGTLILEGYDKKQVIQTAAEENLTNALLKLSRKDQKKIYYLTGHGEHPITAQSRESYSNAKSALEKSYYQVAEFNLLQQAGVPEDASAVIVAGPQKPVPDAEQQALKDYLSRGGRVLLMLDPLVNTGLSDFLNGYGIGLAEDVVIDRLSRLFGGSERIPVVVEYSAHKITDNFALPTFYPDARSIVPAKEAPKGVHLQTLASTSQNAWAERNLEMLNRGEAAFDKDQDMPGPVPIVVLANIAAPEKQADGGNPAGGKPGKEGILVVAGNSEFAANNYFGLYGNGDFFLNTINFLAEDVGMITVEGRQNLNKPMLLTQQQAQAMFWIVLVIVPLAVLVSGFAVYRVRRSQR